MSTTVLLVCLLRLFLSILSTIEFVLQGISFVQQLKKQKTKKQSTKKKKKKRNVKRLVFISGLPQERGKRERREGTYKYQQWQIVSTRQGS